MIEVSFDLKNYDLDGEKEIRTAARGIVKQNGKYLMVTSNKGDFKFPGGGVKEGESLLDAMCREMQEETGFSVQAGSAAPWLVVHERRKGLVVELLEMDSHYFFCQIDGCQGELGREGYEIDEDQRPVWMDLEEALAINRRLEESGFTGAPWLLREIKVMERLLEDGGQL